MPPLPRLRPRPLPRKRGRGDDDVHSGTVRLRRYAQGLLFRCRTQATAGVEFHFPEYGVNVATSQ